jgi:type I restriction enzyme S subunit
VSAAGETLQAREPGARYLAAVKPALVRQFELLTTAPGGVGRLRELILALAVQGKLTRRDALAEPASALLARILKQKESLIASGKIKRDRPLLAISEADLPFDIPQLWCWTRLGGITNYGSPLKAESIDSETWVLDLEDIEKSTGRLLHRVRRSERPSLSEKNSFQAGDVLYGKLRPYLNKVIVADEPGVCTTELVPFRCYGDWVPQYFKTALSSPYFLEYVNARSYGMKMPRLGTEDARAALLPLPPLEEQARIVARVDDLMRLCDALEAKGRLEAEQHARLLGTLLGTLTDSSTPEELAANWQRVADHFDLLLDRPEAVDALEQTILQLAVRGLLVPQLSGDRSASSLLEQIRESGEQKKSLGKKFGAVASEVQPDEVPFEVPDSWAWSRFGQIAEIASDLVQPAGHGSEWQVAPDCIEKGTGRLLAKRTVADADVKSANHRFHPGQIIYSKIRPSLSKAVIVDFAGLCSADMYPINAKISPQYLLLVILSRCFLDQVAAAENRVKMPKLNQESLTAFLVPVPPLAEQARIVARVTELRRLCTALRQRLAASQTIQSLLADALVAEVA